ncbi:hypothetical protein FRB99_007009 [Tulasnella sp. 403]|nr:hypothetical protein FRB99_007009 [Tulasnella sp. 403]
MASPMSQPAISAAPTPATEDVANFDPNSPLDDSSVLRERAHAETKGAEDSPILSEDGNPTIRKCPPYWHTHKTPAKERWLNREILEMISTEFRDRSVEYYRHALKAGVTKINGKVAYPGTIIRNGDIIENTRHRHEPPITSIPVKIVHRDEENGFIVIDKPPSIPVHGVGRYYKHSIVQILKTDFGIEKPCTVNRLDRLTSGCMFIATNPKTARILTDELFHGSVKKEETVEVDQPLLSVDRQMGLNIVHPEGKVGIFLQEAGDGVDERRVSLRGPYSSAYFTMNRRIPASFSVYLKPDAGPSLGKGGLPFIPQGTRSLDSVTGPIPKESRDPPQDEETPVSKSLPVESPKEDDVDTALPAPAEAPLAESHEDDQDLIVPMPSPTLYPINPSTKVRRLKGPKYNKPKKAAAPPPPEPDLSSFDENNLLPRETGEDIGMMSPVALSSETVAVISALRNQKDEREEYSRFKDVVFLTKKVIGEHGRERPVNNDYAGSYQAQMRKKLQSKVVLTGENGPSTPPNEASDTEETTKNLTYEGLHHVLRQTSLKDETGTMSSVTYCEDCYLPLYPDPKPSELFICLHALRYNIASGPRKEVLMSSVTQIHDDKVELCNGDAVLGKEGVDATERLKTSQYSL